MTAPAEIQLPFPWLAATRSDAAKITYAVDPSTGQHGAVLLSGESAGTGYVHMLGGVWPKGSSAEGSLPKTGGGSTYDAVANAGGAVGNHSAFFVDSVWRQFYGSGGAQANYAWDRWPLGANYTEADDGFRIDFTFWMKGLGVGTDLQYIDVAYWGEADNDNKNYFGCWISKTAQYAVVYTADTTSYLSASAAQTLDKGQYWARLTYNKTARTWTLQLYSDAFVTPLGAARAATHAAGKTFTLSYFGARSHPDSLTADFTKLCTWRPVTVTGVDFKRYYTDSPYMTGASISGAGTLTPASHRLYALLNGSIAAASSTCAQIAYNADGGGWSSYYTIAEWAALDPIVFTTSIQFRCKLVSTGADEVQAFGTMGRLSVSSGGGAPVIGSPVIRAA